MAINVVTSEGMAEFAASGKTEELTSKPLTPPDPPKEAKEVEDEEGLEPEDKELAEKIRRKIGKKHRAMREAEEFAESQYNERRLAESRAAKLEEELAELRKGAPKVEDDPEPDKTKFEDAEKYWSAKIKWEANQAVKLDRAQRAKERQDELAQKRAEAFAKRLDAADKENPGLKDSLAESDELIPQGILNYIVDAEMGPKIARHLAEHPEYVERLRTLSPEASLAEIGKLETKLETKLEKPNGELPPRSVERSSAPAPIQPLNGTTTIIQQDESKLSYKEQKALYMQRQKEKRARH